MQIKVHYDKKSDKYIVNLVDPARLWLVVQSWPYRSPINVGQKIQDLQAEGHTLDQASYDKAMPS
jgi:hypothetical protein